MTPKYSGRVMSAFPEPPAPIPPTPRAEVDGRVDRVASRRDAWIAVGVPQRLDYLRRCLAGALEVAERWAEDGSRNKGIAPGQVLEGEEWIVGPWQAVRALRLMIVALEQNGQPKPPAVHTRADGQTVVRVFPVTLQDRLMFGGFRGEVWIEPGKPATQGAIYRDPTPRAGRTCLVLGAGNVSSIPPMDVLYKLFVENEVVVLKVNPVNAYVGPHLEVLFRSLIDDGFLAIVHGGADVGAYLADHPRIDALHVTGSDRTYDAIVWGADPAEQARRKAAGEPVNRRPFSAELGCVTPVLVVPGPWSASDMEFQARQVAAMVAQNASFNCNAAKVLVTAKGWLQRGTFLKKVDEALARTPPRKAYYPGAEQRYQEFLARYPTARVVGRAGEGVVPWTVLPDVPADAASYALRNEAFCGVLAEVSLDATDAPEFLQRAVPFANDACWGTLSCCVLAHGATLRDHGAQIDQAVKDLRYGAVTVNCWPAVAYGFVTTSWGAYPGHPPTDIQSGSGVVHNAFLLDHPQKSVIWAPFRIRPTPLWFTDHKNLRDTARKLTRWEAAPTWGSFLGVVMAAMRG